MVEVTKTSEDVSVVVVDDSENSSKKISDSLSPSGYNVRAFREPGKALEFINDNGADLIILDDIIPSMNGFRVLQKLKEKVETRAIPVIFISSLREIEEKAKAISLGADDCIVRPINAYELRTRAESIIGLSSLKKEMLNRERLASIGRLAGGVAHEINNPLTGVIANLQLLRREIDRFGKKIFEELSQKGVKVNDLENLKESFYSEKGLKAKLDKFVDIAIDGGNRCSNVVGNLLEYSKPVKEDKIVAVSWDEVIEKTLPLLKRMKEENNINVTKDLPKDLPAVKGSLWELRQVTVSILMNAFQAVSLSEERNVSIRGYGEGGYVVLEIADSGVGIDEDKVNSVFDFFYTSRPEGEGFGLGLSVVNQIVMKYGGRVGIESSEGRGTTLKISLLPFS